MLYCNLSNAIDSGFYMDYNNADPVCDIILLIVCVFTIDTLIHFR